MLGRVILGSRGKTTLSRSFAKGLIKIGTELLSSQDQSVAAFRCNDVGNWEKVAHRSDWRDSKDLAVMPCGRVLLRTCWMDEGHNKRDLEILHVTQDGTLASEVRFTVRGAYSELRDLPLPDGRFGIILDRGAFELYSWKTV